MAENGFGSIEPQKPKVEKTEDLDDKVEEMNEKIEREKKMIQNLSKDKFFKVDGVVYHEEYYDSDVDENGNLEYADYLRVNPDYLGKDVDLDKIPELNDNEPVRAVYAGSVHEFDNFGQYKLAELEYKLEGKWLQIIDED